MLNTSERDREREKKREREREKTRFCFFNKLFCAL